LNRVKDPLHVGDFATDEADFVSDADSLYSGADAYSLAGDLARNAGLSVGARNGGWRAAYYITLLIRMQSRTAGWSPPMSA
jgi:hypothetical protein